jgi:DNA (cytosine-5)-methyltransferase 1
VFVVGYLGDWRRAAAVLFERESLSGHPAPRREAGKGTAPTLSARTKGGGGLGTDFDLDGGSIANTLSAARGRSCAHDHTLETYLPVAFGGNNQSGPIDVATAQTAQTAHGGSGRFDFESETFVAHALRGEGFDASEDGTGRGTPLVPICFSAKDHGADAINDLAPTLRAGGHAQSHTNAGVMPAIAFRTTGNDGCYETGDIAPCLNTASDPNQITLLRSWLVRRLMPRECERLQGFPDDWTLIPHGRSARQKIPAHAVKYAASSAL